MDQDASTQLPEGTLRTSHRESQAVKRKPAPRPIAERARALVDGCSGSGPIIRQRLDIERMKQPLQKGLFYVAHNPGNAEPGFLVFLPGVAPIFLQTKPKAPPPCFLRMRVSPVLGEGGGTILVASLDNILHTLRLEDVWMWRGEAVFDTKGYSERRKHLREFVERFWVPDPRLMGGITTSVLNPKSLEAGLESGVGAYTMELFPEMPGRRRLWFLPAASGATGASPATAAARGPAAAPPQKQESPAPQPLKAVKPQQLQRDAWAKPVEKMPDIYDLYDDTGFPITRASVQRFSTSQELRVAKPSPQGVRVRIEWRQEFGGYEIISLIQPA